MEKKSKAGGHRAGSGRPRGTGKYGERTCAIRVPVSLLPQVEALLACKMDPVVREKPVVFETRFDNVYAYPIKQSLLSHAMPLYETRVAAGFPSPADDHIERHLDLNEHLVERPAATFFVRVEGDSMINAGIHENDILIVDRSIQATHGKVVIAVLNSELTVKRWELQQDRVRLIPANDRYRPIDITEEMDFRIWGVVVHVIHSL